MGIPVLVIGKSGSGKSTSLRNFDEKELALINVISKPLPFKKKFESTLNTDNYTTIIKAIFKTTKREDPAHDRSLPFAVLYKNCGFASAVGKAKPVCSRARSLRSPG